MPHIKEHIKEIITSWSWKYGNKIKSENQKLIILMNLQWTIRLIKADQRSLTGILWRYIII